MILDKLCRGCGDTKPLEEFYRHSYSKSGVRSRCKVCDNRDARSWNVKNKDRVRDNFRRAHFKRKFGVKSSVYDDMLKDQKGKCAICFTTETNYKGRTVFAVDHCHKTGKIRGLLCNKCNQALGLFNDSCEALVRASEYLRSSDAKVA